MSGIFPENMKFVILLSSIVLVAVTQASPPPRSVNVALETSFLFNPRELNDNLSFVNNIRRFLDKLYKTLEPETAEKHFRTESKSRAVDETALEEFLEIMQNIGQKFLNMTAPKLRETLDTIHVEVKNKTKEHQTIISQILPNKTQVLFKEFIDSWMTIKPEEMKIIINSTVTQNKPLLTTIARRMNSYYNTDDVRNLNKILKKFKRYINTNKDTTKIIKKLLHNTVFKKYDNLNESAKAAVMGDLKMLSDFLVAKNSLTGPETRRNSPSHEFVDKSEFPDDISYNALRRSIDKKIRNAKENKEAKKRRTNDFFEGNMELFVETPQNP